ncbi:hypothetical protein OOU_Y34scaffold00094g4 [Pyricularia oryzae Y34]|uniref:Uncharacterized protein n=1 Tax=Pyricularia oryzae (strain Y34) TaxID=1143189 RepID=A0AA97P967_PYRO3|nr:hypothetical protein OOU_Y34scaffold00094g4 [Pyricularia oryzae Y34]
MWNQKMEGDKATWSYNTLSDYICLTSPESGYTANSEKLVRSGHGQFEQRIDMTLK